MEDSMPQDTYRQSGVVSQSSTGSWIITFLLLSIPLVNIILLFIWAFDAKSDKRNFSRAYLIVMAIMFALTIVFTVIMFMFGLSAGVTGLY